MSDVPRFVITGGSAAVPVRDFVSRTSVDVAIIGAPAQPGAARRAWATRGAALLVLLADRIDAAGLTVSARPSRP